MRARYPRSTWRAASCILWSLALLFICLMPVMADSMTAATTDDLYEAESTMADLQDKHFDLMIESMDSLTNATKAADLAVADLGVQPTNDQLVAALQSVLDRLDAIENARAQDFSNRLDLEEERYDSASQVLVAIIRDAKKLEITERAMRMATDFQINTDPLAIGSFRGLVSDFSSAMAGPGNERMGLSNLSGLATLGGFFASPYASLVYSVVSLFHSKKPKPEDKPNQFERIASIANVSLQARDDSISLQTELRRASEQLSVLSTEATDFFTTYAGTVGYAKTFEEFSNDPQGPRELSRAVQRYFAQERESGSSVGIVPESIERTRYNLRMLSSYVSRYGAQLRTVDAILSGFGTAIEGRADDMAKIPAMAEKAPDLVKLGEENKALREDLRKAYVTPIVHWENFLLEY